MHESLGAKTILYPTPLLVVGSYDPEGRPNIMAVAWGGLCCSQPPCVAVSLREATYSYGNITHSRAFTVNVPAASQVKEADYAGLCSGRDVDKFEAAGLTPIKSDLVNAPYIEEFPLVLECEVRHVVDIGLHKQFIGEILDVKADKAILDAKGNIDVSKLQPIAFAPGDRGYYRVGEFVGKAFSIGKRD